jgi:hypothetical protein
MPRPALSYTVTSISAPDATDVTALGINDRG